MYNTLFHSLEEVISIIIIPKINLTFKTRKGQKIVLQLTTMKMRVVTKYSINMITHSNIDNEKGCYKIQYQSNTLLQDC